MIGSTTYTQNISISQIASFHHIDIDDIFEVLAHFRGVGVVSFAAVSMENHGLSLWIWLCVCVCVFVLRLIFRNEGEVQKFYPRRKLQRQAG